MEKSAHASRNNALLVRKRSRARAEAPPLACTPRPGARSGSYRLQGPSWLFRHEAPRSQSGSGCSSAPAREHARRLDIRARRLAEPSLPVVSQPSSLEAQVLALGAVAPSGAECSPDCGGARFLPSEHSRDTAAAGALSPFLCILLVDQM